MKLKTTVPVDLLQEMLCLNYQQKNAEVFGFYDDVGRALKDIRHNETASIRGISTQRGRTTTDVSRCSS